jgi:hypothetical protein
MSANELSEPNRFFNSSSLCLKASFDDNFRKQAPLQCFWLSSELRTSFNIGDRNATLRATRLLLSMTFLQSVAD